MKKRTILVLAPIMPQCSELETIAPALAFLKGAYQLDFVDPLAIMAPVSNSAYYELWWERLSQSLNQYDAFIGFSFGGVILQQCFSLFENLNKPLILFSTPSFADASLREKLGEVISLCEQIAVEQALASLYRNVFLPHQPPAGVSETEDKALAASRLIFGLQRVLTTDSRSVLAEASVEHLHLIGENSHLVNQNNVVAPKTGRLVIVPGSSMRVLQDNLPYCQKIILESLQGDNR